jgi:hypothetical protein
MRGGGGCGSGPTDVDQCARTRTSINDGVDQELGGVCTCSSVEGQHGSTGEDPHGPNAPLGL